MSFTDRIMSLRPICSELAAKAASELNEDPNRTLNDIETIRQWLKQQPHLSSVKISNQKIVAYLRGCKFSIEKCKQKLDMYYTIKTLAPELFSNRDPFDPKIQEVLKSGIILPFSGLTTADAARFYLLRMGCCNPSKFTLTDMLKVSYMITEILLEEDDNTVIGGIASIIDVKNLQFGTISQFTPTLAKKSTTCSQKIYPIRQKAYYFVNISSGLEIAFGMFKSALNEKSKSRIVVHNQDMVSLPEYIPKHLIPKELGGDGESIDKLIDYWKTKVESYRDWFLEDDMCKSDEKKRPGKPKTTEDIFGIDGSFRQINVD